MLRRPGFSEVEFVVPVMLFRSQSLPVRVVRCAIDRQDNYGKEQFFRRRTFQRLDLFA